MIMLNLQPLEFYQNSIIQFSEPKQNYSSSTLIDSFLFFKEKKEIAGKQNTAVV